MIFWANACATHSTQCEFIAVNGQAMTSAFHKVVHVATVFKWEGQKLKSFTLRFLTFFLMMHAKYF